MGSGKDWIWHGIARQHLGEELRYFGHVIRKDTSIEKQLIQRAVEGRRCRGRPITLWTDDISHGMEEAWMWQQISHGTEKHGGLSSRPQQCLWVPPDLRKRESSQTNGLTMPVDMHETIMITWFGDWSKGLLNHHKTLCLLLTYKHKFILYCIEILQKCNFLVNVLLQKSDHACKINNNFDK